MQETPSPLPPKPLFQSNKESDDFFGLPKTVWITASIIAVVIILAALAYTVWEKGREVKDARAQVESVRADKVKSDNELNALKEKLAQGQARIDELQHEKEAAVQTHKSLEDEMRAALESKDVTISKLQGKLTVNILDRILFDSGEAVLKPDGEAVLMKVGEILKQHSGLKIHVIGHTDNVPIRSSSRSRFPSNWELSTARATAAVRFLVDKAGVDPTHLGALGYGEFRPVADNRTSEGRAKNRRIEITVLSDEMAGVDTASMAHQSGTNAVSGVHAKEGHEVAPQHPVEDTNTPSAE